MRGPLISLVLSAAAAASGCAEKRVGHKALAVASDQEAAVLVERFLRAHEDGHIDTAASFLCEQDDAFQQAARDHLRKTRDPATRRDVVSARAKWHGATPFFYVEVAPGPGVHVRSEAGCIQGLVGAPPVTTPATPPERPDEPETTMDAVDL